MSGAERVNYFITNIDNSSRESVARSFWGKFVQDLQKYVEGLNSHRGSQAVSIHNQDEQSIEISYEGHLLNVLLDARTGTLRYWFITPKLGHLSIDERGITHTGTVQLDIDAPGFSTTSAPPIKLGNAHVDPESWPAHDRLAQYLLQKLIVPGIVDERF